MSVRETIGIGVCQKRLVQDKHFSFTNDTSGHGLYIITAGGFPYSNHQESKNGKQAQNNFLFKAGDSIECTVDPKEKTITFRKRIDVKVSNSSKSIQYAEYVHEIEYSREEDNLYPVVLLQDPQDSVTIEQGLVFKNQIHMYCKGADSVIMKGSNDAESKLEKVYKNLLNFGKTGLRTLLVAERKLDSTLFQQWEDRYNTLRNNIEGKQSEIEDMQLELEQKMTILGATAIEDKLQDEVPQTIRALREAGIKLWVLTGDKVETAINIGFSSKLLDPSMKRFEVTVEEEGMLSQVLQDALEEIEVDNPLGTPELDNYALVISGESLSSINIPAIENLIYQIAKRCKVVLCCRVSPKQKEQIVSLVRKKDPNSPALAIGDGANDVNMLTAAHVGIGIKGLEGQQAARASDYALKEFKYLRKLLFYHGRECYRRNAQIVTYNFYKNVLLVLPQFWYGFTSHFSGQTLYDSYLYQFFNMFFSSLPIMIYAIFDEEVKNGQVLMTENQVRNFYKQGLENRFFKPTVFWKQYLIGVSQAGIIVWISVYSLELNFVWVEGSVKNMHFWQTGTMIFSLVVLVVNLKILTISFTMSIGYWVFIWASWLSYLAFWYGFSYFDIKKDIYNTFQSMNFVLYFHLGNILGIAATALLDYFIEIYSRWSYELDETVKSKVKKIQINGGGLSRKRSVKGKQEKQVIIVRINQGNNTGYSFSQVENIDMDYDQH